MVREEAVGTWYCSPRYIEEGEAMVMLKEVWVVKIATVLIDNVCKSTEGSRDRNA